MKKQLHQINPLVVVADAARAQFFTIDGESKVLVERSTQVNGEARLRDQDLTADGQGRSFDSKGGGRHAMEPSSGARANAVQAFADEVAKGIPGQLSELDARQLILVAAPKFLGMLRKALPAQAKQAVYFEIDADFTTRPPNEVTEAINKRLGDA